MLSIPQQPDPMYIYRDDTALQVVSEKQLMHHAGPVSAEPAASKKCCINLKEAVSQLSLSVGVYKQHAAWPHQ